ncbi:SDR family oxidoreductase [Aeromicrobium camelliae]|uniref:SDR family oxidoreductase n=1 Tax=Aeromicrobium camelliae TaxID=1538144 RepID=A0A3N6WWA4_9ACTN|nr:SDR family NAD(P)-dependent oxidoreductase [Aeromicrobium camelliae]RQN09282.1 SDR family oxidoreductase [Aeromicrobium camelliae]
MVDRTAVPDYLRMLDLSGKVHLVVGAGQGIGRQAAHALAQAGSFVVCLDNDSERAQAVATELDGLALTADVLDEEELIGAVDAAASEHGRLDGVVDIVGMARFRQLTEASEEDWQFQFDIVLKHARWLVKHSSAQLSRTAGTLTYVSSIAGLSGAQGNGVYAAAKAALISLVQTAAVELAPSGVRVNSVAPSVVLTPRMREILDPPRLQRFVDNTPIGRLSEPADIAAVLLFLASPMASYITGQTLVVDGGVQARLPYPDFV